MNYKNNGDLVIGVIIIFVVLVAILAWKFSNAIGVDVSTGSGVLIRLMICVMGWGFVWFSKLFTFRETLPVFLCTLWPVWWPVLDYWSSHSILDTFGPDTPLWYAGWHTKFLGFFVLAALGFGVKKLAKR